MKELSDNAVAKKSKEFAVRIVKLCNYLQNEKHEFCISKQLFRSGTSIGANIFEALRGQSRADFKSKLNIALKEASESDYWIDLLKSTEYLSEKAADSIQKDCIELIKLLTSIIKSLNATKDEYNLREPETTEELIQNDLFELE